MYYSILVRRYVKSINRMTLQTLLISVLVDVCLYIKHKSAQLDLHINLSNWSCLSTVYQLDYSQVLEVLFLSFNSISISKVAYFLQMLCLVT